MPQRRTDFREFLSRLRNADARKPFAPLRGAQRHDCFRVTTGERIDCIQELRRERRWRRIGR